MGCCLRKNNGAMPGLEGAPLGFLEAALNGPFPVISPALGDPELGRNYTGLMDDIALYDRVLAPDQIEELWPIAPGSADCIKEFTGSPVAAGLFFFPAIRASSLHDHTSRGASHGVFPSPLIARGKRNARSGNGATAC